MGKCGDNKTFCVRLDLPTGQLKQFHFYLKKNCIRLLLLMKHLTMAMGHTITHQNNETYSTCICY